MPKRSRSHELEELSVAQFNALLPSKWVSRPKLPDYGIDREVEIFDEEGCSTGLAFLVQLRATDDPARADRVRLETDELDYYRQLDLPVAVVRYCSVTNGFHWQWEASIRERLTLKEGQESFTYRFDAAERWNASTPFAIIRTLQVRRALKNYPAGAAIPVRLNLGQISLDQHYPTGRAIGDAMAQCAGALTRPREQRPVEVEIVPRPSNLTVRIDTLATETIELGHADPASMARSALYAITKLLLKEGLRRQSETIARVILERGESADDESLALSACQALAGDPLAMTQLAILNGFHHQTVVAYPAILFELSRSGGSSATRAAATEHFFSAALDAARAADRATEAAVHYSMGNHYRAPATAARSLHHFNKARRLRPAYLSAEYFLRDVGGVLYEANHPAWAAKAYEAAQAITNDPFQAFLLGDALLRSGRIAEAEGRFADAAARHPRGRIVQEAKLKRLTCQWLQTQTGKEQLPVDRSAAFAAMKLDGHDSSTFLRRVISNIDGLNPLAHFNLGVHCSEAGIPGDAWFHFLACAFIQPGDLAAWSNAAICALGVNDAEPLIETLAVAIQHAGPDAYEHLRTDLQRQGADADAITQLDAVAVELIGDAQASAPEAFTMRILNGDSHEALTIINP